VEGGRLYDPHGRGMSSRSPLPGTGTTAVVNPSRAASCSRRSRPRHAPEVAGEAHLPQRDSPSREVAVQGPDATATASARSDGGSSTRAPPTVEAYTSFVDSGRPALRCSTASTIWNRPESSPVVTRPRRHLLRRTARRAPWISASSGRRPSRVTVTQVPGTGLVVARRNSPDGSGTSTIPRLDHLEAADLVSRPVPVLGRPDHAEPGVSGRPRTTARRRRGAPEAGVLRSSRPSSRAR